jgi:hypothetical protein
MLTLLEMFLTKTTLGRFLKFQTIMNSEIKLNQNGQEKSKYQQVYNSD